MISIIVFSKDRPMQLHAYLESLRYWSGIPESALTVLYAESEGIPYDAVRSRFPGAKWIREADFYADLAGALERAENFVMFGCDDVIFSRPFDINDALAVLAARPDVFGFSLRLGLNIEPRPPLKQLGGKRGRFLEWDWRSIGRPHWNYPWELDATVYRKDDVLRMISGIERSKLRNPNLLEAEIGNRPRDYVERSRLACFKESVCLVLTVNQVQNVVDNGFDASGPTSPSELAAAYASGVRLDYRGLGRNRRIHVDSRFCRFVNAEERSEGLPRQALRSDGIRYGASRSVDAAGVAGSLARRIARKALKLALPGIRRFLFGYLVHGAGNRVIGKPKGRFAFGKGLRVAIAGKGNAISIDDSCRMERSSIRISGNANNVRFNGNAHGILDVEIVADGCTVEIGEGTGFTGTEIKLWDNGSAIRFASDTIVARDTKFYVTDFHCIIDSSSGAPLNGGRFIEVGEHCWIGEGVMVLKNVAIANRVIVAAKSVVSRSLEKENAMYAGIPAVLKKDGVDWVYDKFDAIKSRRGMNG